MLNINANNHINIIYKAISADDEYLVVDTICNLIANSVVYNKKELHNILKKNNIKLNEEADDKEYINAILYAIKNKKDFDRDYALLLLKTNDLDNSNNNVNIIRKSLKLLNKDNNYLILKKSFGIRKILDDNKKFTYFNAISNIEAVTRKEIIKRSIISFALGVGISVVTFFVINYFNQRKRIQYYNDELHNKRNEKNKKEYDINKITDF